MKNIFLIAAAFYSDILFAQDDIAKSSWILSPVKIDGNAQEWKQPLRYYDPVTKLFFAFENDDKNLYICFQAPDEMDQLKIMRGGMDISLSTKNKHKASINFPITEKDKSTVQNEAGQKTDRLNHRTNFLVQNTLMEVKGFATKNGIIAINDSSGINAAINWDTSNKLTYEISIPLSELFGASYSVNDISKEISLNAQINAVKKQDHSSAGDQNFSGGSGHRMGAGRGGSGHHNTNANMEEENAAMLTGSKTNMTEKTDFKEKFILAAKK